MADMTLNPAVCEVCGKPWNEIIQQVPIFYGLTTSDKNAQDGKYDYDGVEGGEVDYDGVEDRRDEQGMVCVVCRCGNCAMVAKTPVE